MDEKSQISRSLILLFEQSRASTFVQRWAIGWRNNYTWLALQEGHTNVRNVILSSWQGSHFSCSPHSVQVIAKIRLLFISLHGPCNGSKLGKLQKHGPTLQVFLGYFFPPHLRPDITSSNFKTLNFFHIIGQVMAKIFWSISKLHSRLFETDS